MKNRKRLFTLLCVLFVACILQTTVFASENNSENMDDYNEEELAENDYILYFVNAGDPNPETVGEDYQMGLYASNTEQMYGEDVQTGQSWGLVTQDSAPSGNDDSSKFGTLRYYTGEQFREKAIQYTFDLPDGEYDVTFGFKNPWSERSVNIIMNDENVSGDDLPIGGNNEELEATYRQFSVTDGELEVRIQGPAEGDYHQHNDPLINYIIVRQHVTVPITDLEDLIAVAQVEAEKIDEYTTASIEHLIAMIVDGNEVVDRVKEDGVDETTIQADIHAAMDNIQAALGGLMEREDIGIGLTPFVTSESAQEVANVRVQWNEVTDADHYVLYRSDNTEGNFQEIYSGNAKMISDYDLDMNRTYAYKIHALEANGRYVESEPIEFTPFDVPDDAGYFHNNEEGGFHGSLGPGGIEVDGTYYSYRQENDEHGFKQINLYVSDDGENWTFDQVVMDRDSHPDLEESNLESGTVQYNENTGEIVGWYHYENNIDYSLARLAVASGEPGEEWTFHGSFRPNGNESRDKAYFIDDDGTGYIMSSANMNADFILYELTDDHLEIEREMMTLFEGQHREGPGISEHDGHYYIFTSGAAGWYPTQAMYASAPSMEGPWSELRPIGNANTYGSQSGHTLSVSGAEATTHIMNAYRWMHGWALDPGGARDRWFPISMHDGYAFYDYFEKIYGSASTGYVYGYQDGKLLSQGKPATAQDESEGNEASKANDGDYETSWVSADDSWPKWWQVDLGDVYELSNVQISWFLFNGSEAAHQYEIEASIDGENFEVIFDGTDNKNYGFTSDAVEGEARYVRINLIDADLHNNPNNWYTPQLSQVKVFGHPHASLDLLELTSQKYVDSGDVRHPMSTQLSNSLRQIVHHKEKGSLDQAIQHLQNYLKHLHRQPLQHLISDDAKQTLDTKAHQLLENWQG